MIWIKVLLFTVFLPGSVCIFFPYILHRATDSQFSNPIHPLGLIGMGLIFLGSMIYGWTVIDFVQRGKGTPAPLDPPRHLVRQGLYRYSRNPMYVGVLSVLIGETLMFKSHLLLGYTCLVFVAFHVFIVCYEEPNLRRRFGKDYLEYCETVPRWLPGRTRLKPGQRR